MNPLFLQKVREHIPPGPERLGWARGVGKLEGISVATNIAFVIFQDAKLTLFEHGTDLIMDAHHDNWMRLARVRFCTTNPVVDYSHRRFDKLDLIFEHDPQPQRVLVTLRTTYPDGRIETPVWNLDLVSQWFKQAGCDRFPQYKVFENLVKRAARKYE